MWPLWLAITAAARRRRRHSATDADVRDAIRSAESDGHSQQSAGETVPDRGVACIGDMGQSVFAPAAKVTLHEFSNTTLAGVSGQEWIKTDRTVDVEEVA